LLSPRGLNNVADFLVFGTFVTDAAMGIREYQIGPDILSGLPSLLGNMATHLSSHINCASRGQNPRPDVLARPLFRKINIECSLY
jgi:hypothetical protein